MKIGVAISLSLLGHGIVLMSWPGTTNLAVNSTPSSFQVTLQQQAIKTPITHQDIKSSKTIKKVRLKKTEVVQKEIYNEKQKEQAKTTDIRLNTETRAHVIKRIMAAMENHFQYPMLAKRNDSIRVILPSLSLTTIVLLNNPFLKSSSL